MVMCGHAWKMLLFPKWHTADMEDTVPLQDSVVSRDGVLVLTYPLTSQVVY